MITNFHTPVNFTDDDFLFAGHDFMKEAYAEAIKENTSFARMVTPC